ncbi:unnamed protein product, partial [Rhizoctonia solani]
QRVVLRKVKLYLGSARWVWLSGYDQGFRESTIGRTHAVLEKANVFTAAASKFMESRRSIEGLNANYLPDHTAPYDLGIWGTMYGLL